MCTCVSFVHSTHIDIAVFIYIVCVFVFAQYNRTNLLVMTSVAIFNYKPNHSIK